MITRANIQNDSPFASNSKKIITPASARAKILLFHSQKRKTKTGTAPIYCRITLAGKATELSTGIYITNEEWNKGDIKTVNKIDSDSYKAQLSVLKTKLLQIETGLIIHGKGVSASAIKNQLFAGTPVYPTFLECFDKYLERQNTLIGIDFGQRRYDAKERYRNLFKDFLKVKYHRKDIEISDVREKVADEFLIYCKTVKKYTSNYIHSIVSLYKMVLSYAVTQEHIHTNFLAGYKVKRDKRKEIKSLSINEVRLLQEKSFESIELTKTLDCFLFQCYTGLAYIDLYNFNTSHIHIDNNWKYWILINRQKSAVKSTIPLLPQALDILHKYSTKYEIDLKVINQGILPVYSNQVMNRHLKK